MNKQNEKYQNKKEISWKSYKNKMETRIKNIKTK